MLQTVFDHNNQRMTKSSTELMLLLKKCLWYLFDGECTVYISVFFEIINVADTLSIDYCRNACWKFLESLLHQLLSIMILECGPMPNLMAALPHIGGALCSTPQSLADAHY